MIQKFHPIICPSCKSDLTCEEAVTIHFSAAGHEFDVRSDLDFNGYLIDPENLVINGYHAGTHCSQCTELLDEVEPSSKQRFTWLDFFNHFSHLIAYDEEASQQEVTIFYGGEFLRCSGFEQTTEDGLLDKGHWFLRVEKVK